MALKEVGRDLHRVRFLRFLSRQVKLPLWPSPPPSIGNLISSLSIRFVFVLSSGLLPTSRSIRFHTYAEDAFIVARSMKCHVPNEGQYYSGSV